MKVYGRITTFLTIVLFPFTMLAQEADLHRLYTITEGYWITDSVVIDLRESGYIEDSTIILEVPSTANSDTGFILIDKGIEEDAVIAAGDIVVTNKTDYLYFLSEIDSIGNIVRSPDPEDVTAYEWSFLGFGNHYTAENAIILREYLEGSLETRGKKWYFFKVLFTERENESMQLYGFLTE